MAMYTTSLEVLVNNLCDDRSKSLDTRIASARSKIFDFDYPVPDKIWGRGFKEYFETAFINKYLFMEFGQETVGKWKQRVKARLLEVMPKYCAIYKILDAIDYNKVLTDKDYAQKTDSSANGKSGSKSGGASLPENMLAKGTVGNFAGTGYADTASISRTDSETNAKGTVTVTGRTISQLTVFGEIDENFNEYFSQLLDEFSDLFMVLYF